MGIRGRKHDVHAEGIAGKAPGFDDFLTHGFLPVIHGRYKPQPAGL